MAIKLEVEGYCQECMDFKADVTGPERAIYGNKELVFVSDTIVRCEYRNRCRNIKRYLERQLHSQYKMATAEEGPNGNEDAKRNEC